MGSNTPRTLTVHHVGHLCTIRLNMIQRILSRTGSSAGTWTSNLGRYHRLARQPHVRNITDTRGSPAAARRGRIPGTVWSFCSSWRLTCSKVKWNSIRTRVLLSCPAFPEKVRAATSGRTDTFSFQTAELRVDRKSQAGQKVCKWASDVASAGVTAGSKGLQHQFLSLSRPIYHSSLLSPLCPHLCPGVWKKYSNTECNTGLQEKKWEENEGGGGVRKQWVEVFSLDRSLTPSVKAGMTRLKLGTATKV